VAATAVLFPPLTMRYLIGKTVSVLGDTLHVLLLEHTRLESGQDSGVPASMAIPRSDLPGAPAIVIGQPGSFVEVALPVGSVLGMVISASIQDLSAQPTSHLNGSGKRMLEVLVIGTLSADRGFQRGSEVLPTIGANVYAVPLEMLEAMRAVEAKGRQLVTLGKLSNLPGQPAVVNLDALLSRHLAVLGQTGAGKSWTVAALLQQITKFPHASTILLDLHGEYGKAFGSEASHLSAVDLELPFWLMSADEMIDICIERNDALAPLQMGKFKELLQEVKEANRDNRELGIPKITVDTPVYFEFQRLIDEMRRLDSEIVLVNLVRTHGPLYGQFSRSIMRIESRLNDRRYDLIFNPQTFKTSASMEALFRKILGEEAAPKKLVVLDLSPLPFEIRPPVISLILRCLFDFTYWYKRKHGRSYPVSVFCDEAHTYLNDQDPTHKSSRLSAERIAKEGRKYGISLGVITQRPREISSTILSQCNSFLCLRISNPDDQQYIRNLLPDSMKGIMSMISTLRRGELLVVGDAVMMPTRITVDPPNPSPDSRDVSFADEWSKPHAPIDVAGVLTMWRRQGL